MFDLIVKGGHVVTPGNEAEALDIAVKDGRIAAILAPGSGVTAADTLDATGKVVLPGALDVHVHLGHGNDISRPRAPSDAASETAAAASGGVTTFIPYLLAAEEHSGHFDEVLETTRAGSLIDFGYHLIISTEDQLANVPRYVSEYGVPSFKIFMNNRNGEGHRLGLPDIDDAYLYRLAEACAAHGAMLCPHPESIEVAHYLRKAVMEADPDGSGGLSSWNASRPPFVEADAVQRAARLCKAAGAPIYIVHTSSGEAFEAALDARRQGVDITIETCPHYLTHDTGWDRGTVGKINPPLREKADCDALWRAILDGHVDTIASDHVHRTVAGKDGGIWKASPGCPGLETLLPVMLTEGHHKRGLPLSRIASLLSEAPARAMGLWGRKGAIRPGFDADIAIVDIAAEYEVTPASILSDAGYSIYEGRTMRGTVTDTLVRGKAVFRNGAVVDAAAGHGTYLRRTLSA